MKTMRMLGVATAVLLVAGSAVAENANQRVVGKKGIGYFNGAAPVGVRYWMNDGMAIDVGVGLDVDTKVPVGTTDTSFFDWAFDVGMPWVLHGEENMIVYFRPGVTLVGDQVFDATTPAVADDKTYDTSFDVNLGIGGEFFLGQLGWPNLSFSGQVGVGLQILSPGGTGQETDVNFFTTVDNVNVVNTGSIGFHFYF